MDRETRRRIEDYFDPWDLVEFLDVSIADIVDRFEDLIEARLDELDELMGVREEDE